jgi:sec-independent protein translocase protein TatA
MGRIGATELLLILGIALLLFGGTKLAEMGKGLGEGLRNFKKGLSQDDEPKPNAPPPVQASGPGAPPVEPKAGAPDANKGHTPPTTG